VGGGHGLFARKSLLAGAHITLVENCPELVCAQKKLNVPGMALAKVSKFMPEGITIKDTALVIIDDAIKGLDKKKHINQYDIVQLNNVLHYMTPKDAQDCLGKVFKCLKPGGRVYARVHAKMEEVEYTAYEQARNKGSDFPGYMLVDQYVSQEKQIPYHCTSLESDEILPPAHIYDGKSKALLVSQESCKIPGNVRIEHCARLFFDPASFAGLFKRAGFNILSHRFEVEQGELKDIDPKQATYTDKETFDAKFLCLVAQKTIDPI